MFMFLFVFAIDQLSGLIEADYFFKDWSELEVVEEFGSIENQVEIYDVCQSEEGYFLVGGAVRYEDLGGMDAVVFYFENGMKWYKTFGGARDEAFLSCFYDGNLLVSGYTYSPSFYAKSVNFKTGFYMELSKEGVYRNHEVIPYSLDVMPTIIWKDDSIKTAGFLDNFGNTDIFLFENDLRIISFSGQDRLYRKEGEYFLGSTTSKELGAVNRNLLKWNESDYEVIKSDSDQTYWYFGVLENELDLKGVLFDNGIRLTKDGYLYTLTEEVPELLCETRIRIQFENSEYEYCETLYKGNKYLFDMNKIFDYRHNIISNQYYNSFTLLYSGSGLLNGEPVETGTILKEGKYAFSHGAEKILFEVIKNDTDFLVLHLPDEKKVQFKERSINKKLLYLPLIVIGNFLYKKYQ